MARRFGQSTQTPGLEAISRGLLDYGTLPVLAAAVFLLTPAGWPRWTWMWLFAFSLYAGCKWLTWCGAAGGVPLWGVRSGTCCCGRAWMPRLSFCRPRWPFGRLRQNGLSHWARHFWEP